MEISFEKRSTAKTICARARGTFLGLVYKVIFTALLKAVSVECDHFRAAAWDVAGHGGLMLVVGAVWVACVVWWIIPNIAGTGCDAVAVEVNISSYAGCASVISCTVGTRRSAGSATGSLIWKSGSWTLCSASIIVKVASDAWSTESIVGTAGAVWSALSAGDIRSWIVENGATWETQSVELNEIAHTLYAVVIGCAVDTVALAGLTLVIVSYCLSPFELTERTSLSARWTEKVVCCFAFRANCWRGAGLTISWTRLAEWWVVWVVVYRATWKASVWEKIVWSKTATAVSVVGAGCARERTGIASSFDWVGIVSWGASTYAGRVVHKVVCVAGETVGSWKGTCETDSHVTRETLICRIVRIIGSRTACQALPIIKIVVVDAWKARRGRGTVGTGRWACFA